MNLYGKECLYRMDNCLRRLRTSSVAGAAKVTPWQEGGGTTELNAPAGDSKMDFAYDTNKGYEGLLLHAISPSWACRLYPWLAIDPVEKLASLSLLVCGAISSAPNITTKVPLSWTHASWGAYISAFHRASLIDLRLLRLLLRQFDTWYMIANMILNVWTIASGTFPPASVLYGINMALACTTTFIFDCVRVPLPVTIQTCVGYACICYFWGIFSFLEQGPARAVNYHFVLFGSVRGISVFIGRMATIGTFFVRYSVNLISHPEAYVVLRLPILFEHRDALVRRPRRSPVKRLSSCLRPRSDPPSDAELHDTTAGSPTAGDAQSSSSRVDGASTSEGEPMATREGSSAIPMCDLLLAHLLPCCSLPSCHQRLYKMLTSHTCVLLLNCAWGVGAVLPSLWLFGLWDVPLVLVQGASLLLHLPSLQRLLLMDVRLVPLLASHFDTYWIGAQVVLGLVCLAQRDPSQGYLLSSPAGSGFLIHVLLSTATVAVLPDALHMSARHKLMALVLNGGLLLLLTLLFTVLDCAYLDSSVQLIRGMPIASVLTARLLMLAVYCMRFAVKLWARPDTFVVLSDPMYRKDEHLVMLHTLRDAARACMLRDELGISSGPM